MDPRMLAVAVVLGGLAPIPVTDPGMSISVEVRSPVIGSLTVTPPAGTDTTPITVVSSAGCATPSDGFSVLLFGPGVFTGGVPVLRATGIGFSTTAPITAPLERTLADAAELDTVLAVGTYRLALVCLDRVANKASGMFVGQLFVTTPTTYQTTEPPPPTTTPTTTPAAAAPPSRGGLSYTGAAVATLILAGLLLLGGGGALLLLSRRRVLKGQSS